MNFFEVEAYSENKPYNVMAYLPYVKPHSAVSLFKVMH
jgi:hypothetical protein